ncbi:MAG: tail fiber domain-containing protein [Gemmatimonadota bacterium]|nr:MAG: tail fiber domain-containing protein [Gemmatimonadota bacterium]
MMKQASFIGAIVTLILVLTHVSSADVPQLINFQGKLHDNAGNPLTGQYEITFRIYTVESGGTHIWTETINVSCNNGLYNVILGLTTPMNLDFDDDYWLSIQITGDNELTPRYRIVSVPVAFRAAVAESAYRVSWSNLTDVPAGFADGIDNESGGAGNGWVDTGSIVRLETGTDRVGIGMDLPEHRLDVKSSGNMDGMRVISSDHDQLFRIRQNSDGSCGVYICDEGGNANVFLHGSGTNYFNAGNVGIGRVNPTYPLHMGSGAHCTAGGVWTNASSIKYKENVEDLPVKDALETLASLNPVTFNYKIDSDEKHVGFIAENVPDLVATQQREGLSPMDIVAVLTKVVQEQQETIAALQKDIVELKKQ